MLFFISRVKVVEKRPSYISSSVCN